MKKREIIYILIIIILSIFIYFKINIKEEKPKEIIIPKIEYIDSVVIKYDTVIIKIKEKIKNDKIIPIIVDNPDVSMDSVQKLFTGYTSTKDNSDK